MHVGWHGSGGAGPTGWAARCSKQHRSDDAAPPASVVGKSLKSKVSPTAMATGFGDVIDWIEAHQRPRTAKRKPHRNDEMSVAPNTTAISKSHVMRHRAEGAHAGWIWITKTRLRDRSRSTLIHRRSSTLPTCAVLAEENRAMGAAVGSSEKQRLIENPRALSAQTGLLEQRL